MGKELLESATMDALVIQFAGMVEAVIRHLLGSSLHG